jgi:hypothetical protein
MTMRVTPMATGANGLPLNTLAPTAKVRKNDPISSTAYFRAAVGAAATAGGAMASLEVATLMSDMHSRSIRMALRREQRSY